MACDTAKWCSRLADPARGSTPDDSHAGSIDVRPRDVSRSRPARAGTRPLPWRAVAAVPSLPGTPIRRTRPRLEAAGPLAAARDSAREEGGMASRSTAAGRTAAGPRDDTTAWAAVVSLMVAGVVAAAQIGKASAALPVLQDGFGLSSAGAAWYLSFVSMLGAVGGAVLGWLGQALGFRRQVLLGLLAIVLPTWAARPRVRPGGCWRPGSARESASSWWSWPRRGCCPRWPPRTDAGW